MDILKLKSPAKLNLHLQVLGKRNDGFHEINSAFTLINLFDDLSFKKRPSGINLTGDLIKNNLILKAAQNLQEKYHIKNGVDIYLKKRIPIESGLGGGSSNAATTLIALNKLWNLNLSKDELMKIGLDLGSDVPFFIYGENAWGKGRGENLEPIEIKDNFFALSFPKVKISTKLAFKSMKIFDKELSKKDFLEGKNTNTFTEYARKNYKEIDDLFLQLEKIGQPRLTGTGSTIFLTFRSEEEARDKVRIYNDLLLVKSLDRSPLIRFIE